MLSLNNAINSLFLAAFLGVDNAMTLKCETDCREEIMENFAAVRKCLNSKVNKVGIWQAVGIMVVLIGMIWGGIYSVYARGISNRETSIKENCQQIMSMREDVAGFKVRLQVLEQSNIKLELAVRDLLFELRNNKK